MKSSLTNMLISLTCLTAIAGGALATVNLLTAEPIAEASRKARMEAMEAILPPFDNDIAAGASTMADGTVIYPAYKGDAAAGAAVETFSDNGFSGRISILAGFDSTGALTGFRVLGQNETPGLGARMGEWFATAPHSITGSTGELKVKNDGGDVDAISGATITSRAFLEAVNRAREAYSEFNDSRQ